MKLRPIQFASAALCGSLLTAPAFADLEEIIVTAQKRSENLQDVPIAISVVTGKSMLAAGVGKVEELSVVVPGFSLTREGAATELYIRGVGSTGGAAGQESGVATFVDGVYMPAQTGATFAFNNVEQIEVLKGPQGTLYGRNATGGAMNITTPTPSHTAALQTEVGYGNLNTTSGRLYATSGLTDAVAVDLAVTYSNQKDGFGSNLATGDAVDYDERFWRPLEAAGRTRRRYKDHYCQPTTDTATVPSAQVTGTTVLAPASLSVESMDGRTVSGISPMIWTHFTG